jgi:hypothetical protein
MNEPYQQNVGQVGISLRDIENARAAQLNHALGGTQQTMSAGYNPNSANAIGQIKDKGEIESLIDQLDNQLKLLSFVANHIAEKFSPVLAGASPSSQGIKDSAPLYTQLGNRLYVMNQHATQLRESLQDIIDRCKL